MLELQGVSKLQRVELSTTSTKVNSYSIFTKCYVDGAPLNNVKVHNINWVDVSVELLLYLANIAVSDIRGKIAIYEPDTSKNAVTFDVKNALVKKFGNIDNPDGNLYITYFIRKATEVNINGKRYLREVGSYEYDVKPTNAYANDFANITLQMDENPFATISGTTVNVNQVSPTAFYTNLKGVYTSLDGTELEAEIKVGLFDRQAEPGDYVYYDGGYGRPDEWDKVTPVVGICFYVNPDDPTDRRMIATNFQEEYNKYSLGLYKNDWSSVGGITLNEDVNYDVFEFPTYKLLNFDGWATGWMWLYDSFWLKADGSFATPPSNSPMEYKYLVELDEDIEPYKKGDIIPVGQYDTLKIIKHRNKILNDSAINLPVPQKEGLLSESDSLKRLYDKIISENNSQNKYGQFYFAQTSLCYAYEPKIDSKYKLNEKFTVHHWYNLSSGENMLLGFLGLKSYYERGTGTYDVLWSAIADNLLYCRFPNNNINDDIKYPDRLTFLQVATSTFGQQSNSNRNLHTWWTIQNNSETGKQTFQYSYCTPNQTNRRFLPVCRF